MISVGPNGYVILNGQPMTFGIATPFTAITAAGDKILVINGQTITIPGSVINSRYNQPITVNGVVVTPLYGGAILVSGTVVVPGNVLTLPDGQTISVDNAKTTGSITAVTSRGSITASSTSTSSTSDTSSSSGHTSTATTSSSSKGPGAAIASGIGATKKANAYKMKSQPHSGMIFACSLFTGILYFSY